MKRDKIAQFYQWSAEFVVAHGLWRKSRGRRPSMSYMGERNPDKAFKLAMLMSEDAQFEDVIIREVSDDSFVREDGWLFGIQEGWEIVPKPGDIARFYGRGVGSPVRGLYINGVKIFIAPKINRLKSTPNGFANMRKIRRLSLRKIKRVMMKSIRTCPKYSRGE